MATVEQTKQIAKYEAASNDKTLPPDVREQAWQKMTDLKAKAAGFAKGGAVVAKAPAKKLAIGGIVAKAPAKAPMKKIVEGKETYASKAAMMKHEKKEPMKVEKKEEKMAKGGAVKPMAKKKC